MQLFLKHLEKYAGQPLPHHLMMSLLDNYKRGNDKIHQLISQQVLTPIKRGLYIPGPAISDKKPEPFLLANHLLGPSYVSLESALSFHGIIPERVYAVTSVTTKSSRNFNTPLGRFTYTHLPLPYYAFGVNSIQLAPKQQAMVASPEKSLTDKIVLTRGVIFQSPSQALTYLSDDLRADENELKKLNRDLIAEWIPDAPKKNSLIHLLKALEQL